jgi:hypothetical protein
MRPAPEEKLMTQAQLDCAVAEALGESVRTVHHIGFTLLSDPQADPEPDDLRLVINCPFCRAPVPYPGRVADGSLAMGECDGCDVYFPFEADEVYAAGPRDASSSIDRRRTRTRVTSVA